MRSNTCRQYLPARSCFLFNTWFSLLVIGASLAATLHVPISRVAWPILIFCCGLVVYLAVKSSNARRTRNFHWATVFFSIFILGAVFIILRGSLVNGEFLSPYPDPWAYTALATFVQNPLPPIGAGLQPIVSFGRNLMGARYGTAGLLALWSEISGTDPCRAAGIYAALILVQTGLGFGLLARNLGAGRILSLGAGVFGVTIGWAPEILKIGNWDQVLFLSFIPFALVRIRFLTFQTSGRSGVMGLGLCLGAMAFAYPEGAAMSGVIYLPLVIWRLLKGHDALGKVRRLAVASGIGLLVCSVYLPTFISFLRYQISTSSSQPARQTLNGLLSKNWLTTFYGLGEQPVITSAINLELIVPWLFVVLSFLALAAWWRKKDGILLSLPTFLALVFWQVVLAKYSYGFYKVLTMFWPVIGAAIFVGMSQLLARRRGFVRPLLVVAFCGLVAGAFFDEWANFQYAPWRADRDMRPFLELTNLKKILGDAPVCLVTQNWFNQMWAVFFLQGYKLIVPHPLNYLGHSPSGLYDIASEQAKGAFLLTDKQRPGAIWHNEVFWLQNRLAPVELLAIDAPNSVESLEGDSFIWLNNQFTDFTVHSDAARQALLTIHQCWPGPSRPEDANRTLIVEDNGMRTELAAASDLKVPLKLNQGDNLVRLSCKETPTVDKLSSGDTRKLLLGIKGFKLADHEEPLEISAIEAPNHVETVQGDSFIWLNNQFTDMTIHSDADRPAHLSIRECWPGPSRPGDKKRTLIVEVNGARTEVVASPDLKVPFKLIQGDNVVRLSCKETATVDKLSSGDTRTLLLGIKGFSVTASK